MKYLLLIHMNPATWDTMAEADRQAVMNGHEPFQKLLKETGEWVGTDALADPSQSRVVRVREGVPAVTDGPYAEAKEFLAGYYVVDCESAELASELAAMMPEARYQGVEVRPIMHTSGFEM